ncbi:MAG: D-alanyl-D-alanine carboxypeptidase/D-alanyl-D-alanine-endopeptidase [Moraxella sp.]|nr:D-alanyl-D-alanine carboxypeptidase/D-alanyl-D-alanine-endopeptidase [Moraxella sp.]
MQDTKNRINVNVFWQAVKKATVMTAFMMVIGLAYAQSQPILINQPTTAPAVTPIPAVSAPIGGGLPSEVQTALMAAGLSPNELSMMVTPLNKGTKPATPILSHLPNTPRIPASTQKLITTAVALDRLGADFVWHNGIYYRGVLANRTLYGDAVLVGSGDPSLDHQRLSGLLSLLAKKVRHITGDIYIDNSRFVNVGYDPNAFDGQGGRSYNAEPSAFLVNFGTVELKMTVSGWYSLKETGDEPVIFYPNRNDGNASVSLLPELSGVDFPKTVAVNHGRCSLPNMSVQGRTIRLNGVMGAGCGTQSLWRNFQDNDALAQLSVASLWKRFDPAFKGAVKIGQRSHFSVPLVVQASKPVSHQIWQINQWSNNVMTEQLALSLPLYALSAPAMPRTEKVASVPFIPSQTAWSNYPKAFSYINHWWQGLGVPAPVMTRASGLCTDCTITATAMTGLLDFMYQHPDFGVYQASLPVVGESGTMKLLARRNPNNPAIGRAWIKTGTLNDTTAMAGYVQAQSGQWYAVVGMINAKGVGFKRQSVAVLDEMLAWTAVR